MSLLYALKQKTGLVKSFYLHCQQDNTEVLKDWTSDKLF